MNNVQYPSLSNTLVGVFEIITNRTLTVLDEDRKGRFEPRGTHFVNTKSVETWGLDRFTERVLCPDFFITTY